MIWMEKIVGDHHTVTPAYIRKLRSDETDLLKDFLYEAIFVPEGLEPPDRSIIFQPELIDVACRKEDGNIRYDYYTPVDSSDELLLVEKWRDNDALADHGKQPHFIRLGELKAEFVDDTIIEKFEA